MEELGSPPPTISIITHTPITLPPLSITLPPSSSSHQPPTSLITLNKKSQHSSDQLILHNGRNFGRSQVPVRIMFYLNKCWHDFKGEVLASLCNGFASRQTTIPLDIDGSIYVFDFLRMLQVHYESRNYRSIAWIDVNGKPFFPKKFYDHNFSQSILNTKTNVQTESKFLPNGTKFPNAKLLSENEKAYVYNNVLFMSNIGNIDPHAIVNSIHEFRISTTNGRARWNAIEKQIEITEAMRGKANVVYGWHAAPAEKVSTIFSDGFEVLADYPSLRPSMGAGIFLADIESPQYSGLQYKVDKDPEKHLILCRVVLGNVERVDLECHQAYSSNEGYDTGSDNPKNPKWYVVWANDINTRIIPVCVVSCQTSAIMSVEWEMLPIEFTLVPRVILEIKKRIPIENIPALLDIYDSFKTGMSTIDDLKKMMKALVGEQKLVQIYKEIYDA